MSTKTNASLAGLAQFDRTTSIWGPITLGLGFLISLGAALFAAFGTGLGISGGELWGAVGLVVATFGVIAVIEPISYYPVLGRSAMYQAFMIGNIANKLLPSALVAQADLNEKPGTRRAELIAGAAIIGAAAIHIVTLIVLVGLLGTWLVGILPPGLVAVARLYILPAVFGAVTVQAVVTMKNVRTTIVAALTSAVIIFVVVPLVPALSFYGTLLAVGISIVGAWFARSKAAEAPSAPASIGH